MFDSSSRRKKLNARHDNVEAMYYHCDAPDTLFSHDLSTSWALARTSAGQKFVTLELVRQFMIRTTLTGVIRALKLYRVMV